VLLQKNWFDLFALGMCQCAKLLSLNTLLGNLHVKFNSNRMRTNERKSQLINENLFHLQYFIHEFERLKVTPIEYAYLKLISVLDSGKFYKSKLLKLK
jgi:hypothetical protein